jgi:hypothetical protein
MNVCAILLKDCGSHRGQNLSVLKVTKQNISGKNYKIQEKKHKSV